MSSSIQEIITQRKKFVSDTFQFYTQHEMMLEEIKEAIMDQISIDLEEESKLWSKWQKKILRLNHFNTEIKEWMKAQKDTNQKRIIEISYLKSSFENQAETAEKHYMIFLSSLDKKKKAWKEEIALYLLRAINQNSQHKIHKREIEETTETLKKYSEEWSKDLIGKISNLLSDINNVRDYCQELMEDIESATSTEIIDTFNSDPDINYLANLKNAKVSNKCLELSHQLNEFQKTYIFQELSLKLNLNYESLKQSFVDVFTDSSMSGLRASIKIVKNLKQTQDKVSYIEKKMEEIYNTFYPHYKFLKQKREKMLQVCVTAHKLEEHTAFRWIETNLSDIFSPIDKKIDNIK